MQEIARSDGIRITCKQKATSSSVGRWTYATMSDIGNLQRQELQCCQYPCREDAAMYIQTRIMNNNEVSDECSVPLA